MRRRPEPLSLQGESGSGGGNFTTRTRRKFRKKIYMVFNGFRKDKDGNVVFFPHGIFGKGHIINDKNDAEKLMKLSQSLLIPMILIPFFMDFHFTIGVIAIFVFSFFQNQKAVKIYKAYPLTSERLKLSQNIEASARICDPFVHKAYFVFFVLVFLQSVYALTHLNPLKENYGFNVFVIIFFMFAISFLIYCNIRTILLQVKMMKDMDLDLDWKDWV